MNRLYFRRELNYKEYIMQHFDAGEYDIALVIEVWEGIANVLGASPRKLRLGDFLDRKYFFPLPAFFSADYAIEFHEMLLLLDYYYKKLGVMPSPMPKTIDDSLRLIARNKRTAERKASGQDN